MTISRQGLLSMWRNCSYWKLNFSSYFITSSMNGQQWSWGWSNRKLNIWNVITYMKERRHWILVDKCWINRSLHICGTKNDKKKLFLLRPMIKYFTHCESTIVCGVPIFVVFVNRPKHENLVPNEKEISIDVYTENLKTMN